MGVRPQKLTALHQLEQNGLDQNGSWACSGLHTTTQELKREHLKVPAHTTKIPRKDPKRGKKERKLCREREKSKIFGGLGPPSKFLGLPASTVQGPTVRAPPTPLPHPTTQFGQIRAHKVGLMRTNKNWPNVFHCQIRFGQMRSNQDSLKRLGQKRNRKEASPHEVPGCYTQFAEAKHLKWKSWIDNEVIDLVDVRKFKPNNNTGRWFYHHQDRQTRQLPHGNTGWVLRGFEDKQRDHLKTEFPASTEQEFRVSR